MVKTRVKNSIAQRDFRGEESISLVHSEIPSYLWSQITKTNEQTYKFAAFLRGDEPQAEYYPSLPPEEYLKLRNVAISEGWLKAEPSKIVKETVGKGKGRTKLNTREIIKQENAERLFNKKLEQFLHSEGGTPTSSLDFRVISMMRDAYRLLKNPERNEEAIYGLGLSLLKLPIKETPMNEQLREDLNTFKKQFLAASKFDIMHALQFYPYLLADPPYMHILPRKSSFALRPNQKRVIAYLLKDEPILLINRASLGAGKTVSAVKLAVDLYQNNSNKIVVFCCASSAIRINVAQLAAATQVPFALYQRGNYLYPPHIAQTINPGQKAPINLIIVDYDNVKQLLENENGRFVLILDEPTIGADHPNDRRIYMMVDVLFNYAPDQIALVSGTLPPYTEFREFYDRIRVMQELPGTKVVEIKDAGSSLGCDLIRPDNTYYVSENLADNRNEEVANELLQMVLKGLEENPLLTRFHNFRRLFSLLDYFENNDDIEDLRDFETIFMNPANWTQEVAGGAVRKLLEDLLNETPEAVPGACARERIPDDQKIDFERILTREAYRLTGGCLVVSFDPEATALEYVAPLVKHYGLQKMHELNLSKGDIEGDAEDYGWEHLAKEVMKEPVVRKETLILQERIQAHEDDEGRSSRTHRQGKHFDGEVDVSISWGFPEELQINSPAHQKLYGPKRGFYAMPVLYDDLPTSNAVSVDLLVLLAMGIGIYDEKQPPAYLDAVINLATRGKIQFLFSNLDISYGVTIPLNRLIIDDDEVVNAASTSTMIQLLGRIGRLGRMALIYTRSNKLENKFNSVLEGHKDLREQKNILRTMERF